MLLLAPRLTAPPAILPRGKRYPYCSVYIRRLRNNWVAAAHCLRKDRIMNYYLAKTDPETYSLDDLERERQTVWDGVTNPQAVKTIRQMRAGDLVFIYHSGSAAGPAAVVGLAKVLTEGRVDSKNPKSAVVDLEFAGRLETPMTLAEIKESQKFNDWA